MNSNSIANIRRHEKGFSPSADERAQIKTMRIAIVDFKTLRDKLITRHSESLGSTIYYDNNYWDVDNWDFLDEMLWVAKTFSTNLAEDLESGKTRIGMSLRTYHNGQRRVFLKYWI